MVVDIPGYVVTCHDRHIYKIVICPIQRIEEYAKPDSSQSGVMNP